METLKILVVDDEEGMRLGMRRSLMNYTLKLPDIDDEIKFDIDVAENGKVALEKINGQHPDILLLDYKLPDITGLEILEQIEVNEDDFLTIMVTAYASLDTAVSAIKSGAFDFLAKPFTPQELRNTVAKAAKNLIQARHIKKLNVEKRKVRFQFISVLGHELKAPLSAVEGYVYMLKDRILGNEFDAYNATFERMLVRTDQMKKLILDLLEMTKIESGERPRELVPNNIYDIVSNSVETMTPDANHRGIEITLNCKTDTVFTADRTEMEIVFNNLISNAVKYNRDNGKVTVNIDKSENKIEISVQDTGIGISPEEAKKLFQEFVRIKNKKTKNIMGSGLGLSTVKKIAQLYNGDVTLESQADIGSKFTVTLFE